MAQPYGLAEILCEAPPLFAMLSSQDWAELSRCGKQLRRLFHCSAYIVVVRAITEAEAVLRGSWAQLAAIMVEPPYTYVFLRQLHWPEHSNLQLIASLEIRCDTHTRPAFIVSPDAKDDQHKSVAAAFRHLQKPKWGPACVVYATVHSHDVEVVTQMAQSDWQFVNSIYLTESRLGHAAMRQLAKGSWPRLQSLDLRSNQLDGAAMTVLIQGKWPSLKALALDSNSSMNTSAQLHSSPKQRAGPLWATSA